MTLHQYPIDPWLFCFREKEFQTNYSLISLYKNSIYVDCKINIIDLHTKMIIDIIHAHNIIITKCQYFLAYSNFLKETTNKTYDILIDLNKEIVRFFFSLLYYNDFKEINKEDSYYLNENILTIHYLSIYFGNKDIILFCEEEISKLLNNSNWIVILEYCLDTSKSPYRILPGKENLFRYLITWLRCFSDPNEEKFSKSLISQLPYAIENFYSYDILNSCINIYKIQQHQIEVSFFTRLCNNCCRNQSYLNGYQSIELNQFNGFIEKEIFQIVIIKDYFNYSLYHLYLKRSFIQNQEIPFNNEYEEYLLGPERIQIKHIKIQEFNINDDIQYGKEQQDNRSKFQIKIFIIKIQKNTTNLSPTSIISKPFSINKNEIVKIGELSINQDNEFLNCPRCHSFGYLSLFGFKLQLLKL